MTDLTLSIEDMTTLEELAQIYLNERNSVREELEENPILHQQMMLVELKAKQASYELSEFLIKVLELE